MIKAHGDLHGQMKNTDDRWSSSGTPSTGDVQTKMFQNPKRRL